MQSSVHVIVEDPIFLSTLDGRIRRCIKQHVKTATQASLRKQLDDRLAGEVLRSINAEMPGYVANYMATHPETAKMLSAVNTRVEAAADQTMARIACDNVYQSPQYSAWLKAMTEQYQASFNTHFETHQRRCNNAFSIIDTRLTEHEKRANSRLYTLTVFSGLSCALSITAAFLAFYK